MTPTTLEPNRRVLLAGAFGQGNPGDEALLSAFARALPDHVPVVASAAPGETTAQHGLGAVDREDPAAVARAVASSDAVVVAGGTVFKTLHHACGRPRHALLARAAGLAALARSLRKPFALVGVGAGALDTALSRRLARFIVRCSDLLVLRDEESAARLAAAGAPTPFRVGADPAWTLLPPQPAPVPVRAGAPTAASVAIPAGAGHAPVPLDEAAAAAPTGEPAGPVVVALSHLAGGGGLADELADGLAPLLDTPHPIQLQPWQRDAGEGGDEELAAALRERLGDAELLDRPRDLLAARDSFRDAAAVVALRFHAVPAAAAAGVPLVAYAHEPKLAGGARRLGQHAVAPGAAPEQLADRVLAAVDAAPARTDAVEAERARAEDGFRLLRVLLARGRSAEAAEVDGLSLRPEEWLG
jgi:polysaccharide pyruvyl transferase WcaK-like protein